MKLWTNYIFDNLSRQIYGLFFQRHSNLIQSNFLNFYTNLIVSIVFYRFKKLIVSIVFNSPIVFSDEFLQKFYPSGPAAKTLINKEDILLIIKFGF